MQNPIRQITFRPLRRIKKTGKITVASYMQWRNIKTADYNKFSLIVNDEYKNMPSNEYVYNSKGEQLFWFRYNPADVPVFNHSILFDLDKIRESNTRYGINWGEGSPINYSAQGLDCDGVPAFSHYTADRASQYADMDQFEVLTVEKVVKVFGWFLYQLENSHLQIGGSAN